MPASDFRAALGHSFVLLDAAMGTRLVEAGLRLSESGNGGDDPCLWNLSHPTLVEEVHRRDVAAGAEVLLTNTFGANRGWLARFGASADSLNEINRGAVALARRAAETAIAGRSVFVVGDLGPTAAEYRSAGEQAAILIDARVDALLFETHRIDQAVAALAEVAATVRGRVPLLVSLIAGPHGELPGAAIKRLVDLGAEAVGVNCQDGIESSLELAESLREVLGPSRPLIVKPAAGTETGARRRPADTPETFAQAVPRLRALAPLLAGGCCGTNEAHLAALRTAWYDPAWSGGRV